MTEVEEQCEEECEEEGVTVAGLKDAVLAVGWLLNYDKQFDSDIDDGQREFVWDCVACAALRWVEQHRDGEQKLFKEDIDDIAAEIAEERQVKVEEDTG